ncbi:hypothetical protein RJT34_32541 [Clitoria ternatea]|uniref:RING-type domain-containing protein n=1 Tax=Clitoria ternatea TaxID=43366 RepID=A0AAN9EYP4_CLITE
MCVSGVLFEGRVYRACVQAVSLWCRRVRVRKFGYHQNDVLMLKMEAEMLLTKSPHLQSKWCPAPGCEYAVTFDAGSGNYDVCCLYSYGFCWNCNEEAHRPVDCDTVAKWILKNSAESENMNWYRFLSVV